MDLNQDWREWLESLNSSRADYMIVGGIALAIHGFPRSTGDLDVFVSDTKENARRCCAPPVRSGSGRSAFPSRT